MHKLITETRRFIMGMTIAVVTLAGVVWSDAGPSPRLTN
jgi:energy-converting hydrogenase Eha subunit B